MEIISAREAFNRGLTRYFTGKKCGYGHIAERMISNGSCVSCLNEKRKISRLDKYEATKVWRLKNPGSRAEEATRYRKKYPEKCKENSLRYKRANIEEVRRRNRENKKRMRECNIEKEKERIARFTEKKKLLQIKIAGREKPSLCEICGLDDFRIVFDHSHSGGHFRGWICDRFLGVVKDDITLLEKLILYLRVNEYGKIK